MKKKIIEDVLKYLDLPECLGIDEEADNDTIYFADKDYTEELSDWFYEEADTYYEMFEWLEDIEHGVSKLVLIPRDTDFVIKIPFAGGWSCVTDYDEEINGFIFTPFDWLSDYCKVEADMYQDALLDEDEYIAQFLCKTEKVGTLCSGQPVYIQERAIPFADYDEIEEYVDGNSNFAKEQYKKHYSNCGLGKIFDDEFTEYMIDYYADTGIVDGLLSYAMKIGDMHNGNYGFSVIDKRPVLLDFSDYMG